ncbi:MAG: succinylglutamate desuccinylase/aspartoacylase family protein [Ilumatobacteraceae bacterium]|nr:succinylglutamate desuccinylase/aspartoacylase family protein [Ilumatobacteraceae bacterium]
MTDSHGVTVTEETLGADIDAPIVMHRFRSAEAGPTITLFGGVHGDELEGVLATSMLLDRLSGLLCGEVRVVPRANPSAVAGCNRESIDDGKNLARCFPGDPAGSYTDRIAHVLTESAIRGVDGLIDLHSSGYKYAMPFFGGYVTGLSSSAESAEMLERFAPPIMWRHDTLNPGRSLSAAADLGVPAIYVEASQGGGVLQHAEVMGYVDGVTRVLVGYGMLDQASATPGPDVSHAIPGGSGNSDVSIPTAHGGYCLRLADRGDTVRAGDPVAEIRDDRGHLLETIVAPFDGVVMLIRAIAPVEPDDVIVMVGPPFEPPES